MHRRARVLDDDETLELEGVVAVGGEMEGGAGKGEAPSAQKSIWDDSDDDADAGGAAAVDTKDSRKRGADASGGAFKRSKNDEDEGGGGSDDDDYLEMMDSVDFKSEQAKVLKQCESFSASLRSALGRWDDNAAKASNGRLGQEGCVRLTKISDKSSGDKSGAVLTEKDFEHIIPNLKLKEYQLVGVNWLKLLHYNPPVNGVLADDMGLGKTIQTIAFLGWLKSNNHARGNLEKLPHLICVPASTLANWEKEIALYLPDFEVASYHGSVSDRTMLRQTLKAKCEAGLMDIILTTYSIFEKEACGVDRAFMRNRNFDYLVLDEAHCLKNSASSRYLNLNNINPKHRLLLSGTPVQNNVFELLSLLSFIMPNVFSARVAAVLGNVFKTEKKTMGVQALETLRNLRSMLAPFVLRRLKMDVLNQLVDKRCIALEVDATPFQKRVYDSIITAHARRKERMRAAQDQEELAARTLEDTDKGKVSRKAVVLQNKAAASAAAAAVSSPGGAVDLTSSHNGEGTTASSSSSSSSSNGKGGGSAAAVSGDDENDDDTAAVEVISLESDDTDKTQLISLAAESVRELSDKDARSLFTALRKAASHPLLLRVRYHEEDTLEQIARCCFVQEHFGRSATLQRVREELVTLSDYDLHQICCTYSALSKYLLPGEVLYDSSKLQKIREMLPALIAEGHHVLIFSQWTRIMDLLEEAMRDLGLAYLRLDGSTPVRERQDLIETFSEGNIPVFLLSTKAGGLGINLTKADTVILHDLDFNPEADRQAEDRCHRIGQTRPVTIYKMFVKDTVEEDIHSMGVRKMQLSDAVLSSQSSEENKNDIYTIGRILQSSIKRMGSGTLEGGQG